MSAIHFIKTRKALWDRMESLLKKAGSRGPRALTEDELLELTRLYPVVTVDVSQARLMGLDRPTQQRLNSMALTAHGLLYTGGRSPILPAIHRFLFFEYPDLFRRLMPYFLLSLVLTFAGVFGAYAMVRIEPSTAYFFVPAGLDVSGGPAVSAEDVSERYRDTPQEMMAAGITTNNIGVAFYAFAFGIVAGLGTCYVLLMNGMMLGGFFGHFANHGLLTECFHFLVPHGALEVFAILVAGAAGLRLGLSLFLPGRLPRSASLRAGAKEACKLVLGTIPMFFFAGLIESYITPSYLLGEMKILIGLGALAVTLAYLLILGRNRPVPAEKA